MKMLKNKYVKLGIAAVLYILWVIWVGNFWLLLGLPVIYDIYILKKVNWTPWKSRTKKNSTIVEWIDALIFAVVAVTLINIFLFQNYKIPTGSMEKTLLIGDHLYVSKIKYGPKLPNTPIAFPFVQSILPGTKSTKSYLDWPHWSYKRLKGFTHVKNNDNVVFNFPEGDTVILEMSNASYYDIVRQYAEAQIDKDKSEGKSVGPYADYYNGARQLVWAHYEIVDRPIDRRDNYIKRCAAIPGDSLQVIAGQVYINGKAQPKFPDMQYKYRIITDGSRINPTALENLGIYPADVEMVNDSYIIPLTAANVEKLKGFSNVRSVEKTLKGQGEYSPRIFPHNEAYPWNEDFFGPLWMPEKGATINLTLKNLSLYQRIISAYEGNKLEVKGTTIYINDKPATKYTFKMGYYFMMGDNRHNSADSRFWGFVPEDHIVGAPRFVWLSLDSSKKFPWNIRWKRMFTGASN